MFKKMDPKWYVLAYVFYQPGYTYTLNPIFLKGVTEPATSRKNSLPRYVLKKTCGLEQGKSTEDMATLGYGYIHVKVWQFWVVTHVKNVKMGQTKIQITGNYPSFNST